MKKRLLATVLTASMVASLSACGGGNAQDGGKGEAEKSEGETRTAVENYVPTYPIVDEPITVTGLVVGGDTSVSESRLVWDKVSEVTGINIEWVNIDQEALSTYLAGDNWPDFFHTGEINASMVNDYGVLGGRFVNYLDYLDIMPNLAQTYKEFPAARAITTQLNGEIYNLFGVSGACATNTSTRPHVRLDVLKAAGINELPTTVDELYDSLVVLKEKNGEPGMVYDQSPDLGLVSNLFSAFGTLHRMDFDDDGTGKAVYTPIMDQTKHYYEFLNKLYEEDLMNREWMTLDDTAKEQLAKSGKVAYISGSAAPRLSEEDLGGSWDNLGCLAPLTSEYDDTRTLPGRIDYRDVSGMFINKDSKYVEEICKMFDIAFATEEVVEGSGLYGQTFVYGFEGKDWELNDDGTYSQMVPEPFKAFSAYQLQKLEWRDFGRADAFGSAITSTKGNAQARQKGYVANVLPYMIKDHIFPQMHHLKFTDDEQYVIDNKYADIKLYMEEMRAKFITGAASIETDWDSYVKTCEQMGINEVLEIVQTSYDRWNESLASAN